MVTFWIRSGISSSPERYGRGSVERGIQGVSRCTLPAAIRGHPDCAWPAGPNTSGSKSVSVRLVLNARDSCRVPPGDESTPPDPPILCRNTGRFLEISRQKSEFFPGPGHAGGRAVYFVARTSCEANNIRMHKSLPAPISGSHEGRSVRGENRSSGGLAFPQ